MRSYGFIQTGYLRETAQGLMLAQALKRQQPESRIVWVGRQPMAPLARVCPAVDVVLEFARDGGLAGYTRLLSSLRREAVETVLDLQGLLRTALLLRLSGARVRVGRRDDRELCGFLYGVRPELPPTGAASNGADILRYFLPALGLRTEFTWPLDFGPARLFNPGLENLREFARPVILFPGAFKRQQRWGGFAELTNFILLNEPRSQVIWAGEEVADSRESWRGPRFLNLTGRTTIDALPTVLRQASLVVATDTGVVDLAAFLNRPTLTIYGPTEAPVSGPPSGGTGTHRAVRAPLAELNRLSAREVWDALRAHPSFPR
jgi:ADP-heptose:LPS heptosyltransferase